MVMMFRAIVEEIRKKRVPARIFVDNDLAFIYKAKTSLIEAGNALKKMVMNNLSRCSFYFSFFRGGLPMD